MFMYFFKPLVALVLGIGLFMAPMSAHAFGFLFGGNSCYGGGCYGGGSCCKSCCCNSGSGYGSWNGYHSGSYSNW